MNLYKLTQTVNDGYDTYDSIIVIAETEKSAKKITPPYCTFGSDHTMWCESIDDVNVEYLGIAKDGSVSGLVLCSFNAG